MPAYVPTGPWTNGGAPGISAAFLGTLESWIQQAEGATGSSTINGSTAGTATVYYPFQRPFKLLIVQLVGFCNGGLSFSYFACCLSILILMFCSFLVRWAVKVLL